MIKTIIRLQKDMVMVFDENGEQVPVYQGRYPDMRKKLLRDAPEEAVFSNWFDDVVEAKVVTRENW
ncbi:hypothetical protein ACFLUB_03845 [Chloroflexota bacterium]